MRKKIYSETASYKVFQAIGAGVNCTIASIPTLFTDESIPPCSVCNYEESSERSRLVNYNKEYIIVPLADRTAAS